MQETWVWSLGREDPLVERMATHFSILAWRITMDREAAWPAMVHGVGKESDTTEHICTCVCTHTWLSTYACTHTHTHRGILSDQLTPGLKAKWKLSTRSSPIFLLDPLSHQFCESESLWESLLSPILYSSFTLTLQKNISALLLKTIIV